MKITTIGNTGVIHAPSLPDVMRYLIATPPRDERPYSIHGDASASWDLNAGWEGTLELCRTGWAEGGRAMRVVLDKMERTRTPILETKYNPVRGQFSIGRFVTGSPNCFKTRRKLPNAGKPVVKLAVNISSNAGTNAQALANMGAAIAQAVRELEAKGNMVEVSTYDATELSGGKRSICGWTVKRAGGKLDLAALAFSVGHPAAMRRIGFALMERLPASIRSIGAYGGAAAITKADLQGDPSAIIFNLSLNANYLCQTPEMAVQNVQRVMRGEQVQ